MHIRQEAGPGSGIGVTTCKPERVRALQSGRAIGTPKAGMGGAKPIRALRIARGSALDARSRVPNQLHGLRVTAPDELREEPRPIGTRGVGGGSTRCDSHVDAHATAAERQVPLKITRTKRLIAVGS